MATKPLSSTLPRYADTVAGDPSKVSEPPSGKKDIGWVVGEKPPAQWMNWLLLQCYNWLVWLDAFETESHTWTKLQTFAASVVNTRAILATGNGSGSAIKGIGGAAGNGIEAEASGAGTYALYGKGTAIGVIGVRGEGGSGSVGGSFVGGGVGAGVTATGGAGGAAGVSGLGTLAFSGVLGTGGATGKGGEFYGGAGGSPEGAYCKGGAPDGHGLKAEATGTGYAVECIGSVHTDLHVFADQTVAAGIGGSVNTMHGSYSEWTTPVHAVAGSSIKDRVAPCNTARMLATITTDGVGGITVQDDQGVTGAAIVGGNKIQVTFVDAMSVAGKYQAVVSGYDTGTGGGNFAILQGDKLTASVQVLCPSNPSTNVLNFDIVVTGRQ